MATCNEPAHEHYDAVRKWASRLLIVVGIGLIAWQGTVATRLTEQANKERERTEIVIASQSAATVMCDSTHRITLVNPAAERLFGYTHDEMIGKPVEILMPAELKASHAKAIAEATKRAETMPGNWLLRKDLDAAALHRDGHEIPVQMEIRTIKYGGSVEFIASIRKRDGVPAIEFQKLPPLPLPQGQSAK